MLGCLLCHKGFILRFLRKYFWGIAGALPMLARNNMVMGIPVMAYNMNATFPFVVLKIWKIL
jgi:hypothetical protein